MYKCLSCGAAFSKPFFIKEIHNELAPSAAEVFAACPVCMEYDVALKSYTEAGRFRRPKWVSGVE